MSDGDNAAPGRRSPGPPDDADSGTDKPVNDWLTRSVRPAPGAAPCERGRTPSSSTSPVSEGNHTDGVPVADLIAKISGTPREEKRDEPEQHETGARDKAARDAHTEIIPVFPAHASELPVLTGLHRGPATLERVGAVQEPTTGSSHRGRRTAMVMGRVAAALIAVLALASTGAAWQWQASKNNSLNKVAALDPDSRDIVDPGAQFGDENFLIVGTDSRIGTNSDMGAGTTDDAAGSCSRLSSTSSVRRVDSWATRAAGARSSPVTPSASAIAVHMTSSVVTASRGTK